MAGSAGKNAATLIAACLAGPLVAHAQVAARAPKQASAPAEWRWAGDDASGRWSLLARAQREPTDPLEARDLPPMPPAALRGALDAETSSSLLSFEAQRFAGPRRWTAALFASRASLVARDDLASRPVASFDAFDASRAQRSRYGTTLSFAEPSGLPGLVGERRAWLSFRGETRDARTLSRDAASGAESILQRASLAESRLSIAAEQSFDLPRGARLVAAARLERFHGRSGGFGQGAFSGSRFVPSIAIESPFFGGLGLFARVGKGTDDENRPLAAIDPWRLAASGHADPELRRAFGEYGVRMNMGPLDARLSLWRTHAADEEIAFGEAGAVASTRPGSRHGYDMALRYRPVTWLDIRGDLLLQFARDAAASGPGAPRVLGSANATLRMSRDLDAAVGVSYVGRRDGIDERATLSSAALVNGQLVRWFGRTTRISFHVFNALNRRVEAVDAFDALHLGWLEGTGETFLASPTEPRAFLVKFRTRF